MTTQECLEATEHRLVELRAERARLVERTRWMLRSLFMSREERYNQQRNAG